MEIVVAVAVGLNPYVGALVLAALAAFTSRAPETAVLAATPPALLMAVAALAGLASPVDFIFGKFVRFAPRLRRASQTVAPLAGGLGAALVSQSELPLPLVVAGGAATSWCVSAMITALAARGSRSPAWVGLGHVPILMAAATAAACILPLALANAAVGLGLALSALATLSLAMGSAVLVERRTARRGATRPVAGGRAVARVGVRA